MKDELNVLLPESKSTTINDEVIEVKPFVLKQWKNIREPLSLLVVEFMKINADDMSEIIGVINKLVDEVSIIVQQATGKDQDWVDNLFPDQFVEITLLVIEVNKNRFLSNMNTEMLKKISGIITNQSGQK